MSDHRPITAAFTVMVKGIDPQKYLDVEYDVRSQQRQQLAQIVDEANLYWIMESFDFSADQARNLLQTNNGNFKEACKFSSS